MVNSGVGQVLEPAQPLRLLDVPAGYRTGGQVGQHVVVPGHAEGGGGRRIGRELCLEEVRDQGIERTGGGHAARYPGER